jgi:RNA polymerase sigma factor (sigma-70 family)
MSKNNDSSVHLNKVVPLLTGSAAECPCVSSGSYQGQQGFDEARVRRLLAGGDEAGLGLALLHQHLEVRLCAWIGESFPGLLPEDLADVWSDALLGVLQAVRQQRFQGDRSLFPWLCRIARARAIDQLRRQRSRTERLTWRIHLPLIPIRASQRLPRGVVAHELSILIQQAVERLPARQRLVLRLFLEHYPATRQVRVLCQEVSQATGVQPSPSSIRRALQEGRRKVQIFLRRKGYTSEP